MYIIQIYNSFYYKSLKILGFLQLTFLDSIPTLTQGHFTVSHSLIESSLNKPITDYFQRYISYKFIIFYL